MQSTTELKDDGLHEVSDKPLSLIESYGYLNQDSISLLNDKLENKVVDSNSEENCDTNDLYNSTKSFDENCADLRRDQCLESINVNFETDVLSSIEVTNSDLDIDFEHQANDQMKMKHRIVDWSCKYPKLIACADSEFKCTKYINNYLRGCMWSPDGSCLLTNSYDNQLRIFNLPSSVMNLNDFETIDSCEKMTSVLVMKENELIYDYCWYPLMNSLDPVSCCLASTSRRNPIRLWDAFTGTVRACYRPYNHLGEVVSAASIAFSTDGGRLYAGFNRYIQVFDVTRPGSESVRRPKLGKKTSQGGIISCISVLKDPSKKLYATGSYNGSVCIYSEPGNLINCLTANLHGVTQVMFYQNHFNSSPWYVIAGGRMNPHIFIWEARNLNNPICVLNRRVENNQRFQFDIDNSGSFLFTGNQTGLVCAYDLTESIEKFSSGISIEPKLKWRAHVDSAHSVSINQSLALLATTSGQRRISLPTFLLSKSDSDSDDCSNLIDVTHLTDDQASQLPLFNQDEDEGSKTNMPYYGQLDTLPPENCLKLWSFPYTDEYF